MPPKQANAPFAVDERVFCFHMDMLYEARILDVQQAPAGGANAGGTGSSDGSRWRYRIHYKGWKNTWDDWVPQDRVRKFNDENRELANQLRDQARVLQQQKNAKAAKRVSGVGVGGGGSGPGGYFGSGGSATGTATPGESRGAGGRGHHDHHDRHGHGWDSEMASARGSEERTGGGSLAHARGPRRQRDYDLEHFAG
ncbi:histone acetylase complex subunit mrg15-2 [Niveomyces insectorum RCEF 264]|uniref:Chromatin modification-related protein EAF3 n=1 Tax=Niveomyces insectorum RCEF 264 TaxID=1081102 RepID=A0A167TTZ2_9HYPO|nr:histone acetylase complex subunit mrg15-2 [Niveomyces insectorum RCEF 264]